MVILALSAFNGCFGVLIQHGISGKTSNKFHVFFPLRQSINSLEQKWLLPRSTMMVFGQC